MLSLREARSRRSPPSPSAPRTRRGASLVWTLACATLLLLAPGALHAQDTVRMGYAGELIDGDRRPLSGVYPLQFTLHDASGAALWEEARFVSVVEGIYDLRLGADVPIPQSLVGRSLELRIAVVGVGEIMRHPVEVTAWSPPPPTLTRAQVQRMAHAELAARALLTERAGVARNGRRLSGVTLDRIDQSANLGERLDELQTLFERERGAQLGSETVVVDRVGGATGRRYTRNCPSGWVATGARGGAGRLVDGFQIICSRLE